MDPTPWNDLSRALFAPRRARLVEVLGTLTGADREACAEVADLPDPFRKLLARHVGAERQTWSGHVDPREAWEAVAPPAWTEDPRRRFADLDDLASARPWPPSLHAVVTLACDPDGMRAAEELAGEFLASASRAWGLPLPADGALVWCAVSPRRWRAALPTGRGGVPWSEMLDPPSPERAADAEEAARLVRAGAVQRVGGCAWDASAVARAELLARSPDAAGAFAALRGIWSVGYALDRVTDAGCVLVAPAA